MVVVKRLLGKLTVLSRAAQVKRVAVFATDCHCEFNAFIANADLRASDECADIPLMLSAKGAEYGVIFRHPSLRFSERWQRGDIGYEFEK